MVMTQDRNAGSVQAHTYQKPKACVYCLGEHGTRQEMFVCAAHHGYKSARSRGIVAQQVEQKASEDALASAGLPEVTPDVVASMTDPLDMIDLDLLQAEINAHYGKNFKPGQTTISYGNSGQALDNSRRGFVFVGSDYFGRVDEAKGIVVFDRAEDGIEIGGVDLNAIWKRQPVTEETPSVQEEVCNVKHRSESARSKCGKVHPA